jgi:hypothetical protein
MDPSSGRLLNTGDTYPRGRAGMRLKSAADRQLPDDDSPTCGDDIRLRPLADY